MVVALAFAGVALYLAGAVFLPFLQYDDGHFWDSAGHIFSAWFQKTYLFPHWTGWNPFFFAGYPHNTFYGPVYHYVIALFAVPFGLLAAFKIVTILGISLLPVAFYFFARTWRFGPEESALLMVLMMIPVATLHIASGGTLYSQFHVGLGAEALAFPLFFFYISRLKQAVEALQEPGAPPVSFGDFGILTFLSVGMVLTHFVVTLAACAAAERVSSVLPE
jgi:hypothetical protein